MKTCAIMSVRDYENARAHTERAIKILECKRVSVKDRLSALASLYVIRDSLQEDIDEEDE